MNRSAIGGTPRSWTTIDWRDAWNWACADARLRVIDGRARLLELDEHRRAAKEETRQLFHDVVRMRTPLTLKARITRRVDAALQMLLTAIRRIGKGSGKSASRLRRGARTALQSSYAAVPCWIMPTWRIVMTPILVSYQHHSQRVQRCSGLKRMRKSNLNSAVSRLAG